LAGEPAERCGLLRKYFERDDFDVEEDNEQPTAAYRAIAELIKMGKIKMILNDTNN